MPAFEEKNNEHKVTLSAHENIYDSCSAYYIYIFKVVNIFAIIANGVWTCCDMKKKYT